MKHIKILIGWAALLAIFAGSKMIAGCTAAQRAEVKNGVVAVAECTPPAAEAVSECIAQGGPRQWCVARATIPFLECLWQHHLKGDCVKDCPFHASAPSSPDGSTDGP